MLVAVAVAVVVLVATLSLVMMTLVCRSEVVIAAATVADAGSIFISCFSWLTMLLASYR